MKIRLFTAITLIPIVLGLCAIYASTRAETVTAPPAAQSPASDFCADMQTVANEFSQLWGHVPTYWAECEIRVPAAKGKISAGLPASSDDHASFCQSLHRLAERHPDRFEGLDLAQWPFTPCLVVLHRERKLRDLCRTMEADRIRHQWPYPSQATCDGLQSGKSVPVTYCYSGCRS
jgi:hypothetical protein